MFLKFNPLYGNGLLFDDDPTGGGAGSSDKSDSAPSDKSDSAPSDKSDSTPSDKSDSTPSDKSDSTPKEKEDANVETLGSHDKSSVENKGNSFDEGGKSQGISSVKEDNTEVSQSNKTDNGTSKNESIAEKTIESTKDVMENVEKSNPKNESVAKEYAESARGVSEHIEKSQSRDEDTSFTSGVSKTDQGNTASRATERNTDGASNHSPHEGSDRDYKVGGGKPNNGSRDTQPQTVPNYPDIKPNANPHIVTKNGKVLDLDKLGIDPSAELHVFQKGQNDQAQALANKSRSGTIRELHTLDDGSTVVSIRNIGGAPKPKNIEDAGVVSHHKNDNGQTLNKGNTSNQFESKITNSGKTSVSKEDAGVVSHNKNDNGKTVNHGKKEEDPNVTTVSKDDRGKTTNQFEHNGNNNGKVGKSKEPDAGVTTHSNNDHGKDKNEKPKTPEVNASIPPKTPKEGGGKEDPNVVTHGNNDHGKDKNEKPKTPEVNTVIPPKFPKEGGGKEDPYVETHGKNDHGKDKNEKPKTPETNTVIPPKVPEGGDKQTPPPVEPKPATKIVIPPKTPEGSDREYPNPRHPEPKEHGGWKITGGGDNHFKVPDPVQPIGELKHTIPSKPHRPTVWDDLIETGKYGDKPVKFTNELGKGQGKIIDGQYNTDCSHGIVQFNWRQEKKEFIEAYGSKEGLEKFNQAYPYYNDMMKGNNPEGFVAKGGSGIVATLRKANGGDEKFYSSVKDIKEDGVIVSVRHQGEGRRLKDGYVSNNADIADHIYISKVKDGKVYFVDITDGTNPNKKGINGSSVSKLTAEEFDKIHPQGAHAYSTLNDKGRKLVEEKNHVLDQKMEQKHHKELEKKNEKSHDHENALIQADKKIVNKEENIDKKLGEMNQSQPNQEVHQEDHLHLANPKNR